MCELKTITFIDICIDLTELPVEFGYDPSRDVVH